MRLLKFVLVSLAIAGFSYAGTTGKITGYVHDTDSGQPLAGANVIIDGTGLGAATDADGYFVILNVAPGLYDVTATYVGYKKLAMTQVMVFIDLTTELEFKMETSAYQGETVTVVAERPPVQTDVASSQTSVSQEEVSSLPVVSVSDVMSLQAGMEGWEVRSGDVDETTLMMDGVSMKDDRTGQPVSGVALSSVKEINIQSGGFSAEYGNLQSGLVNVVTREGDRDKYSLTLSYKYSPAAEKHFGTSVFDVNSYYLRPYMDPEVCYTGTDNGAWSKSMQRNYPTFVGWNAISAQLLSNDDPTDDLSPEGAKRLFEWQHRRDGRIKLGDYSLDMGFGGPVPFAQALGNLRFYTGITANRNMYLIPMAKDGLRDFAINTKVTSDISKKTKLQVTSFYKKTSGSSESETGLANLITGVGDLADNFAGASQQRSKIWYPHYFCQTDMINFAESMNLTTTLNEKSYLEVLAQYSGTSYNTYPVPEKDPSSATGFLERDRTAKYDIFPEADQTFLTSELPYGFEYLSSNSLDGFIAGLKSNSRDSTKTSNFNLHANYVNQVTAHHQIKTGLAFEQYSYHMNYGAINIALPSGRPWTKWDASPRTYAAYVQDKIEYDGWVATLGLRGEYLDPNIEWWDVSPFDKGFFTSSYRPTKDGEFAKKKAKGQFTLMPRLGIAHPISDVSKLYFNYGHMRQKFNPDDLYAIRRETSWKLQYMGDPEAPQEKTISYELGYEHFLFNAYNLKISGYYKDKSDQLGSVGYHNTDGSISYSMAANMYYQDVKGLEIELKKSRGKYLKGKINYNYAIYSSGYFGIRQNYENPVDQRMYLANIGNQLQSRPLPLPKIKYSFTGMLPQGRGMVSSVLGGWTMTLTGAWQAGSYATYGTNPNVVNNVRGKDYFGMDMKFAKDFRISNTARLTVFADISNVLNIKNFSYYGIGDPYLNPTDRNDYLESLHFKKAVYDELTSPHISGNDRIGDYRANGVDYQPMTYVNAPTANFLKNADPGTYYYVGNLDALATLFPDVTFDESTPDNERYVKVVDGEWVRVEKSAIDQTISKKAYIDMPDNSSFTFLNPRDIFIGVKLSFDL